MIGSSFSKHTCKSTRLNSFAAFILFNIGPIDSLNSTFCPNACGITKISEKRIMKSKLKRLIGCNDISAAKLELKQRSIKFSLFFLYFDILEDIYQLVS